MPMASLNRSILIGAALMMALSMGIRQSLSLFLPPVTKDLGITAADFTLALAIQNAVWGLSQAPVSILADKFGMRKAMVSGAAAYLVGVLLMLVANGTVLLVLSNIFIGFSMALPLAIVSRRRSMTSVR